MEKQFSFKTEKYFFLLSCFLFFLPFFPKASVICIVAMILAWLVSGDFKFLFVELKKDKNIFLFLLFYIMHVVGLAYTTDFSFASSDLQTKFSFLIFPLLFPAFKISP